MPFGHLLIDHFKKVLIPILMMHENQQAGML